MISETAFVIGTAASSVFTAGWMRWHDVRELKRRANAGCKHPDELQKTMRLSNVITMNPYLLHAVIPGRRWVAKHCLGCGEQRLLYRPSTQPIDEFLAEFDQETIDRARQLQARMQAHVQERAHAEKLRLEKRDRP